MNYEEFCQFALEAARRSIIESDRIGHLLLTQHRLSFPKVREPEMRHAFAQEAESKSVLYGIEVPTIETYRFIVEPGDNEVSARHDFVIFRDANIIQSREILIEFKEGSSSGVRNSLGHVIDCRQVRKDFEKLFCEPALEGYCIFHLLHSANRTSLPALMMKYTAAICAARARVLDRARLPLPPVRWFVLFVLVRHMRGRQNRNCARLFRFHLPQFGVNQTAADFSFPPDLPELPFE